MSAIIASLSQRLTPELIGDLMSAAGIDQRASQSALDAAVPAIICSLANLATKPGGARQLADILLQHTKPGHTSDVDNATLSSDDPLSSLLGKSAAATLASKVGRFVGVGEASMRTLIGLLTPLIMGVLASEQRAQGLDASGLARMLVRQKDAYAAAMPAGLSTLLETMNREIDAPAGISGRGYADDQYRPNLSLPAAAIRHDAIAARPHGPSWLYWILPPIAFGGLFWHLYSGDGESARTSQTAALPHASAAKSAYITRAPENWVSLGTSPHTYKEQAIYNRAGERLGTISDLLIGPDGKTAAAVISLDRHLGIGDKVVAVAFSELRREQPDSGRIFMDITRDSFQTAPAFETGKP